MHRQVYDASRQRHVAKCAIHCSDASGTPHGDGGGKGVATATCPALPCANPLQPPLPLLHRRLACMMRKCGLLTFSCTEWKKSATAPACTAWPLIRYLLRPPITMVRVTVMVSQCSYPAGDCFGSSLWKTMDTVALEMPPWPCVSGSGMDAMQADDQTPTHESRQCRCNDFVCTVCAPACRPDLLSYWRALD